MSSTEDSIKELIKQAFQVKDRAHCPYSKFPVGAALLCGDGTIFAGCNVENAVYPLGTCAENSAIAIAVSAGYTKFKAIAVCSDLANDFITPCGSCRQILAEFGLDWDVYMTRPDRSFLKMTVRELLPLGFTPKRLGEERVSSGAMGSIPTINTSEVSRMHVNSASHYTAVNGDTVNIQNGDVVQ